MQYEENKMKKIIAISFIASLAVTGCASNLQGDTYSRDDARQVQTVKYGTVEEVRLVVIEGTKTPIGTAAGAAVGGIAASSIGDGTGSTIAAIVGAVAGGMAGSAAEEAITKSQGVELVIRMADSDNIISTVQAHDPNQPFYVGDRVRVMSVNGNTRVTR